MAPLLVAGLVGVSGWWTSKTVKDAMQQLLKTELQTILSANVTALEIWIITQRKMAVALAGDAEIKGHCQTLIKTLEGQFSEFSESSDLTNQKKDDLRKLLSQRLLPLDYRFLIVSKSGKVICASTQEGEKMGLARSQIELYKRLFSSGQAVFITPFTPQIHGGRTPLDRAFGKQKIKEQPEESSKATNANASSNGNSNASLNENSKVEGGQSFMQVSAPIFDEDGNIIAALGLLIAPEREFTRILSVARSGQTGETFAFDQTGLLISRSRFEDQLRKLGLLRKRGGQSSSLNIELRDPGKDLISSFKVENPPSSWPLMKMVNEAVQGGFGVDVKGFRDYRGVEVVGAWQWLPRYEFGVATKVDAAEAYQPLAVVQWAFATLFLMLLLCAVAMSLFSYLNLNLRQRVEAKELGQYTLLKRIGQGGMGTVFKARHALMRRATAVKLLLPDKADRLAIRRFEHEVQMTARLSHPNTIQIYDYGHTPEGIFYYAMEYLEGISLKELVQEYGPLPESRLIHVLRQVCASLREAHSAHLVHRDIKPANVFLCDRGGVLDTVKVLDFGLVLNFRKLGQQARSKKPPQWVTGTPQFFSPEAIVSPYSVDHRSDVYSLGATAYFLLTGEHVFEAETAQAICEKQISELPFLPSRRTGQAYCEILERAIMSCLEKDPEHRPQSVHAFLQKIEASPHAKKWTEEKVSEWWESHHLRSRIASHARQLEETIRIQPTIRVKIDRDRREG